MARRFRRDRMATLASRLTTEQCRAADEIRECYFAVTRGRSTPPPPALDDIRVDQIGRRRYTHPIERMSAMERLHYEQHYRPWARLLSGRRHKRATALQIVIDVLVDNHGTRQCDDDYGLRRGRSAAIVQQGLYEYAAIAGWVDSRQAA